MKRYSIKIIGSAGVLSTGEILCKIIFENGFFLKAEREFPSLIKGGEHSFLIDFSDEEIFSNSKNFEYVLDLGNLVLIKGRNVLAKFPEKSKFTNSALIGAISKYFGFDRVSAKKVLKKYFEKKYPEENLKKFDEGFKSLSNENFSNDSEKRIKNFLIKNLSIVNGNEAISIGSELAGLSHYFAYPMSPATSVANYFDKKKVFQLICSDEISAVSMCLGAMYTKKNALTATSSGGFDLMTETISASAVMEIPLVVVLSQRPGPGTGLPTWDSQDNINIAVFGGHGDFPRSVLCVSDAESAIRIMPIAFKIAKKHKSPVIVLTQKSISEGYFIAKTIFNRNIYPFENNLKLVNADEHNQEGTALDAGIEVEKAVKKRMKKEKQILKDSPKPIFYGDKNAEISIVCFGNTKGAVLDAINILGKSKLNMLCIESIWPLHKKEIQAFLSNAKRRIILEQNYSGQLKRIIEAETGLKIDETFNKFDGRAFSYEDILTFLK